MDNWNAPQWADFNASLMSDIDEYFDVEHKELEPRRSNETSYGSFTSSPNSNTSISNSLYDTPKSNGFASPVETSRENNLRLNKIGESLATDLNNLQIRSAKKALGKMSMTPKAMRVKKISVDSELENSVTENDKNIEPKMISEIITDELCQNNYAEIISQEQTHENCLTETVSSSLTFSAMENNENIENIETKMEETETIIVTQVYDNNCTKISSQELLQERCPEEPHFNRATVSSSLMTSLIENHEMIETEIKQTTTVTEVCENYCTEIPPQEQPQEDSASDEIADEENADINATLVPSNEEERIDPEPIDKVKPVEAEKPLEQKLPEKVETARSKFDSQPNEAKSKHASLSDPSNRLFFDKKNLQCKQNKPTVQTSKLRRFNIAKCRRKSGEYVSLAEAVARFHNGPSKRFQSTNPKDIASMPLQKSKQAKLKLTCPMSPALLCKTRVRAVSASSQESQPRFKPNFKSTTRPCPSAQEKMFKNAKSLKKIDRTSAQTSEQSRAMLSSKVLPMFQKIDKILCESICTKETIEISKSMRKHTPCKRTAPTIVSKDEKIEIKNVEVLHFGIPVGNEHKKITRTVPFSFDTRNKDQQSKREKLKNRQIEEEKSRKSMFHARPAPSFNSHKSANSALKSKEDNANGGIVRALSFQEGKEADVAMKKERTDREKLKNRQIEEDKSRKSMFHARPAPSSNSQQSTNSALKPKEDNANGGIVRALSFQEGKDAAVAMKKETTDQEKPNNRQTEAEKSRKSLFCATTAPSFDPPKNTTSVLKSKENNANKGTIRGLNLKERKELAMKKKEELMNRIAEQEKRARTFHAKPAPQFKPVFVRGNSAEHLRTGDGNKGRKGISAAARQQGLSQESIASSNQENTAPVVANQRVPKLKSSLITQNLKVKKIAL